MSKMHYYISTGRKHNYYTLRVEFDEPTYYKSEFGALETGVIGRDHYVMKLTRNPETAQAMANKFLTHRGEAPTIALAEFNLNDIGRSTDWSVFHSGKHEGQKVEWVIANDPEYALWAAENLSGKKFAKTVELLQELMAPVLAVRATERAAKEVSESGKQALRIALLKPLADRLRTGDGGFRDSVADSLDAGALPSPKAQAIVTDILARQLGRRDGKNYNAEFESVYVVFEQAEALK